MSKYFSNSQVLPIASQAQQLKSRFVHHKLKHDRHSLEWEGNLQPTPLNRVYLVRLSYKLGLRPKIVAVEPDIIELAQGKRVPHLYSQEERTLCLYFGKREWSPALSIAVTIIPWAALWFYYYETWLVTDEWTGGGIEHP